jgi:hypothetical protein
VRHLENMKILHNRDFEFRSVLGKPDGEQVFLDKEKKYLIEVAAKAALKLFFKYERRVKVKMFKAVERAMLVAKGIYDITMKSTDSVIRKTAKIGLCETPEASLVEEEVLCRSQCARNSQSDQQDDGKVCPQLDNSGSAERDGKLHCGHQVREVAAHHGRRGLEQADHGKKAERKHH